MSLAERIRQGFHENSLYHPAIGGCLRCKRKWAICTEHATSFSEQESMFPLCEECWQELPIEQRLAYYSQLYAEWLACDAECQHEWPAIEAAVRAGK